MTNQSIEMEEGCTCKVCEKHLCTCDERINHFFEYESVWTGSMFDGHFVWVKAPNKMIEMAILCCIVFAEQEQAVV